MSARAKLAADAPWDERALELLAELGAPFAPGTFDGELVRRLCVEVGAEIRAGRAEHERVLDDYLDEQREWAGCMCGSGPAASEEHHDWAS